MNEMVNVITLVGAHLICGITSAGEQFADPETDRVDRDAGAERPAGTLLHRQLRQPRYPR